MDDFAGNPDDPSKNHCPCGYRGCLTSEAPPFFRLNGQVWHWDCLVAAMPDKTAELEAAREKALARTPTWHAWISDLGSGQ